LEDENTLTRRHGQRREQAAVGGQAKRGMRLEFATDEKVGVGAAVSSPHDEQVGLFRLGHQSA